MLLLELRTVLDGDEIADAAAVLLLVGELYVYATLDKLDASPNGGVEMLEVAGVPLLLGAM